MKTMPRFALRAMRTVVEFMLTVTQRWEDRHADQRDYRMRELNTGLWQASQSMRAVIEGDFQPLRRQAPLMELPELMVLGEAYHRELLGGAPVPLHVVD